MVVMVSRSGRENITCDVVSYSSSPGSIQCVTRYSEMYFKFLLWLSCNCELCCISPSGVLQMELRILPIMSMLV